MASTSPGDHLTTVQYRLSVLEKEVQELQMELHSYVPAREHELQLKSIRDAGDRIERDVSEIKRQVTDLNTKMGIQDNEAQKRDAAQRESQDKLQIRVLWGIVSGVLVVAGGVAVYWLTHLPH